MTFGLVALLASLTLILVLNWERFQQMGAGRVIRLLLIWGAIITGLVLLVRLLGLA